MSYRTVMGVSWCAFKHDKYVSVIYTCIHNLSKPMYSSIDIYLPIQMYIIYIYTYIHNMMIVGLTLYLHLIRIHDIYIYMYIYIYTGGARIIERN